MNCGTKTQSSVAGYYFENVSPGANSRLNQLLGTDRKGAEKILNISYFYDI